MREGIFTRYGLLFGGLCMVTSVIAQPSGSLYQKEAFAFMDWFSCHDTVDFDPGHKLAPVAKHLAVWDSELFMSADSAEEEPPTLSGVGPLRAIHGIDSLFSEEDMAEMAREASCHVHTSLERSLACMKRGGRAKKKPLHWYYWPLFSKDRNMVLFRFGYWCGSTCGYGGTYVLRRVGSNEWNMVCSLANWIS